MTIFMHYLKRSVFDPIGLLIFIFMPVALVFLNVEINVIDLEDVVRQNVATNVVMSIMLMFQVMAGSYICEYVCHDLRSETRWRLLAAPVSLNKYLFSAMAASLLFSLITGALVLVLGYFVYDIYMGNIGIVLAVMILAALFGQFLGVILSHVVQKSGTAVAAHIGISWGIFILSGFFGTIRFPIIDNLLATYGTPYSAAFRAIMHSGAGIPQWSDGEFLHMSIDTSDALLSLGVLAGFVAATGIAAWILGRRNAA